jgi:uncharacterized protein with beta-barrel porin domain
MVSRRGERWLPVAPMAAAIAAFGAVLFTVGWVSPAAAQGTQTWDLNGFVSAISIVTPGNPPPPPFTQSIFVDGGGAFSLSVTCGSTSRVVGGRMTGQTVTVDTLPGCVASVLAGRLDAPFPAAKTFSGLEIRFSDGSLLTVVGRLRAGGVAGNPVDEAITLGDIAVISTSVQNRNIGLRLNSLRSGLGGGVSVSGLALAIKGESVPIGSVLSGMLGGGASADPSRPFGKLGIFANGQGSFGDQATTLERPGYDFYTAGLTAGADYRFTDNIILGAAFGYLRTKIDRTITVSDSSINGYSVSLYGTYYLKDTFYVDSILTYGRNDYDIDRRSERLSSSGSGTTIDRITASTDGDQFSASASGGYNFTSGGFTAGPTGRVTYIRVHIDGFAEHGPAGSNAAKIGDQTVESLTTALGGQASYVVNTSWAVLVPQVRAEWEHEFKGNRRVLAGSLLSNPATLLTAQTGAPDRDYFNLGVGMTATFLRGVSAFVHFEEQLGRANFTNHSFTGGVRFDF